MLVQVRERFVKHVDERIDKTKWSEEEDKALKEICAKYEGKLSFVSTVCINSLKYKIMILDAFVCTGMLCTIIYNCVYMIDI